jgi:phosphonate transport system permease protein
MAQTDVVRPASAPPRLPDPSLYRRAGPGAFITSWRNFLFLIIALAALAYGWRVTQVDFVSLVVNLPKSERIFTSLLQPDIWVLTLADAPLQVGTASDQPSTARVGDWTLTVTPGGVTAGQQVTIALSGVRPDTQLNLYLVDSRGTTTPIRINRPTDQSEGREPVKSDAAGNYSLTFSMPASVAPGVYLVRAELPPGHAAWRGPWRFSETFETSLSKMIETIFLALMGTFFALVVSIPLSFLGARNLMQGSAIGWAIYYAVRTLFNVLRSIETLILAVVMAVVVGLGPFAGVMAIVIHSIGAMGKLYSESIESIDPGPIEAITATGANRLQVVLFAVLPQVVPQFLSFTMYRWDINVRLSTVIGLVGGGGIGYILIQYINLSQWNQAATALWMIGVVVIAMDYASAIIREKLV